MKEPPLITANTVLSILAVDYPVEKVSCYVSDDGAAMLTFEALSETSEFAKKWVPFCKKFNVEPRAPEWYFQQKMDYLRDKVHPSFVKERRAMKVRVSAVLTNAPYLLNVDCDHYFNNSKAIREAMCFMMDPLVGKKVCYVQFPQRFDGIDRHDRYANRNIVWMEFKDPFMWALDVLSEDRRSMDIVLRSQRSHRLGLAIVGLSGAVLRAVVLARGRRKQQKLSRKRKGIVPREVIMEHQNLHWSPLKRESKLSNVASLWFLSLFICIFATSILEMRWSGVGIDDWWRNEQFWVIGGVSSHLFAVFQGLLKVLAGIDTNFTVTTKAGDDEEFSELYTFKWTTLLIPPTTLLIVNFIGVVAGVSNAINNGYESWGPLFGKLFFSFWVIVHLYPFLKGLVGRQNRTPTIVIVWSILLASIFSLLWVRIDPFLPKSDGPLLEECGLDCS
ncbi:hypothetical protein GW17_00037595 [Ensete ventricosum]|nr:hypothetical protein GW17_00037595 [Ensete ventricosum]